MAFLNRSSPNSQPLDPITAGPDQHGLAWARLQLPRSLGVPAHWPRTGNMGQENRSDPAADSRKMGLQVSDGLKHQMRGDACPSRPSVWNKRRLAIDARGGEPEVSRSCLSSIGAFAHLSLGCAVEMNRSDGRRIHGTDVVSKRSLSLSSLGEIV